MSDLRAFAVLGLCAASLLAPRGAQAEFYRWLDARGQVRISNIPPEGITSDGQILPSYHPASIAAQRRALRLRLKARDDALQAAQAAAQSAADDTAADVHSK